MTNLSVIETNTDEHMDPFSGEGASSLRLEVTKSIDVALFTDTLRRRTKVDVQAVLSLGSSNRPPSEQYPAVLFVSPGNLNQSLVQSLLDQTPDADAPPAQGSAPEILPAVVPEGDENSQPLLDRLKSGDDLNLAEVNTVLRALLGYPTTATLSATQEAAEPEEAPAVAKADNEPQKAAQADSEGEQAPSPKK